MTDDELEKLRLQQTLVTLISHGSIVTRPLPEPVTICPYCDQSKPDITTRRINTLYHDDESNWITSCLDCYKETIAHYNEMWSDYYAGCM